MRKRSEQFKHNLRIFRIVAAVDYDNFIVGRNHDVTHSESDAFERDELNAAEKGFVRFACGHFQVGYIRRFVCSVVQLYFNEILAVFGVYHRFEPNPVPDVRRIAIVDEISFRFINLEGVIIPRPVVFQTKFHRNRIERFQSVYFVVFYA